MFEIFGDGRNKEKELEELNTSLTEARKDQERNAFALSILSKAIECAAYNTDLGSLYKTFLGLFSDLMRAGIGTLLVEDGGFLRVKEFRNLDASAMRGLQISKEAIFLKMLKENPIPCMAMDLLKSLDSPEDDTFTDVRFYLDPDIFIPLVYKREFLGMVTLGSVASKAMSPDDSKILQSLAAYLSFALADERFCREQEALRKEIGVLNKQLDDARETKHAFLQRLNKAFASLSLLDAEKLKALTVNLVFETVDVDKAVFFLRSEDEISLISVSLAGIPGMVTKKIYFEIDNDFIEKLRLNKKPLFIDTARLKEMLEYQKCSPETSDALVEAGLNLFVPFISNERVLALLALGPKRSGKEFTPLELELLSTISFLFAAAIDNAKLFEAGVLDGLTKVYTRRFFEHRLEYEMAVGMHYRTRRVLSLIMVDLDHFKQVNDVYGHQSGDQVLAQLARIISETIRMTDMVARYGGEEFVIILPELDIEGGLKIAEKIRSSVASAVFLPNGPALKITASFGIASYPDFAKTKDDLISKADKALYKSKESGRNRVTPCSAL